MICCRAATRDDLTELAALDRACVTVHQSLVLNRPAATDYYMQRNGLFVILEDDRIVGFALTQLIRHMHGEPELIWLEHISIHPDFRRRGLGRRLLQFVREQTGPRTVLHANIHPLNEPSLRLFQSCGATCDERVSIYLSPGDFKP